MHTIGLGDSSSNCFFSSARSMQRVRALVEKAARSAINVSIYGQTGTGKEVVAKRIHALSNRSEAPFVAVNVSAIPSELVESSFFGYEKGAFTGADCRKLGFFEAANMGTLFLDEVGEMDLRLQAKLLRALQEGVIRRVGGTEEVAIDVRIITATHVDLADLVAKGEFREDLYYRLMGLDIYLPPLCERREDVIPLAEWFVESYCKRSGLPVCSLSEGARKVLEGYAFPGNVRELKAMMELAVVMCEGGVIEAKDCNLRHKVSGGLGLLEMERTLVEYEEIIIRHFLQKYDNKVRMVAERLNISKTKIYNLLQGSKLKQI